MHAPHPPAPLAAVDVLYEDEALLAVAKPAGIVVHPAYRNLSGTLVDAVRARQALRGEGAPWLLHRLDRETSGVVLFAKTVAARRALASQFLHRRLGKRYIALVAGVPDPARGEITAPLRRSVEDRRRVVSAPDGQSAVTRYELLAARDDHALVLLEPVTGRTHQLRAHCALVGMPVLGDVLYLSEGATHAAPRALLHAWQLTCVDPSTGRELVITAPPPTDFVEHASRLGLHAALRALVTSP